MTLRKSEGALTFKRVRSDDDYDKQIDLSPADWQGTGQKELPPKAPEPTGPDAWQGVSIIAVIFGLIALNHGLPPFWTTDFYVAIAFAAFCLWNYWPRRR